MKITLHLFSNIIYLYFIILKTNDLISFKKIPGFQVFEYFLS